MAERVTDLRDIRDRVIAELSGLPEPGVPVPDVPSILCAEDLAPADTAGLDPSLIVGLATTLGRAHQPHRDHRPPARHPVRGRGRAGSTTVAAGTMVLGRRHPRDRHRVARTPPRPPPRSRGRERDGRRGGRELDGSRRHRRRARRRDPGQRAGRRRRPRRPRRHPPRASACSAPSCASSTATPSRPSTSRRRSTPRCSRRSPAARWSIRTLDAGSDKPLKFAGHPDEANPALGVRGIRIAYGNPGILTGSSTAIAAAAERTGKPAVGDGADDRHPRRGEGLRRRRCARTG